MIEEFLFMSFIYCYKNTNKNNSSDVEEQLNFRHVID